MKFIIKNKIELVWLFALAICSCTNNSTEKETYRITDPLKGDSTIIFNKNGSIHEILKKSDDGRYLEKTRFNNGIQSESITYIDKRLSKDCFFIGSTKILSYLPSAELNCQLILRNGELMKEKSEYLKINYDVDSKKICIQEANCSDFDSIFVEIKPGFYKKGEQDFFQSKKNAVMFGSTSDILDIPLKEKSFKNNVATFQVAFFKCVDKHYFTTTKYFQIQKNKSYSGFNDMLIW